jgi:hypothetical protein
VIKPGMAIKKKKISRILPGPISQARIKSLIKATNFTKKFAEKK